ncbi:hypothetical protein GQ602_003760 [Ophiocordyceps camponoti-floridani]|uniref:Uncharacterized protein n=1 Tax=Ophiocordyceps camponoti-floridani TaxID=2030778 RepID=A0A8H4Q8U8_9HYPO|nr:hypothetical protein GQ602_003760 [Ophiocordyceps camponoti-floridani]
MRFQLLTLPTLAFTFYVSHNKHNEARLHARGNNHPSDETPGPHRVACRYFYRGGAKDASKVFRLGLKVNSRDGDAIDSSCGGPNSSSWLQYLIDAFEQGNEVGYVYVVDSEALIDSDGSSAGIPASAITGAYIYERSKPQDEALMMYNPNYQAKDHANAPSILSLCSAEQQLHSTPSIKNTGKISKASLCDTTHRSKRSSPVMFSGIRALAQSGLSAWTEGGEPPCQVPPDFKFKTKDGNSRLKSVPYISHLVGPKGNPQSELGLVILDVLNKRYDELDIEEACGELEAEQAAQSKNRAFARAREMIEQALGKEKALARARDVIELMEKEEAERREFEQR